MRSTTARLSLLSAFSFCIACAVVWDPGLTIPEAGKVGSFSVVRVSGPGAPQHLRQEKNEERVAALVRFVGSPQRDWHTPLERIPPADYTITLESWSGQPAVVLFVGDGWLGGRETGQVLVGGRLSDLSVGEREELLGLAGVGNR